MPILIRGGGKSTQDVLNLASGITKYTDSFEIEGETRGNVLVQPSDFSDESVVNWGSSTTYYTHSIENVEGSENGSAAVCVSTSTSHASYNHCLWIYTTVDSSSNISRTYLVAVRAKANKVITDNLPVYACYYKPTASGEVTTSQMIYFSFCPTTQWGIYYAIVNIPENHYMSDNTLCFYRHGDGTTYYVDWMVAYDITGASFGNMTYGARATASASDILSGKTAYIDGVMVTGTMTTQTKKVTPTTSEQTITPDSGYAALSKVIVEAANIPTYETWTFTMSNGTTQTKSVGVSTL